MKSDIERRIRGGSRRSYAGESEDAARRLVAEAVARGMADVAYAEADSPFGPLLVAATRRGLIRLAYPDQGRDEVLGQLATRVSPRVVESPERLDEVRRQLDDYFDRERQDFDIDVDYTLTRGFVRKVLRATARIPYGELSTYRLVAAGAGNARAARAAGNALGGNPIPIVVPCHRVIHSTGGLGGYTGGLERKEFLLELEGASIG